MSILGTFVDKQSASRAGDGLTGITVGTLFHSLPATNPEAVIPVMRSIAALGAQANPTPLYVGANASMLSIGFAVPSCASCPTIFYDVYAFVFHSLIR